MSGTIDWTAIATFALALVTAALVAVTVWSRRAEARGRDAVALRAAVYEQLENLRRWQRREPVRIGQDQLGTLRDAGPSFDQIERLIGQVALPDDLGIYLVWLVGDTRRALEHIDETIDRVAPPGSHDPAALSATNLQDDWELLLDRLQVFLCLIQAEAARRHFGSVGAQSAALSWTRPRSRPPGRRAMNRLSEEIYLQAPPFPAGRASTRCSVGARDAEAARIEDARAAQSAAILGPPVG
ncbi:MAG: hypothetical protein ACYDCI_03765 [Candidatus Limnocylindrales bacterium]